MANTINNLELAELLHNIASSYIIKDEVKNKFRIVAYDRAATAIEHLSSEVKDIWDEGKLEEIPGVGPSIAKNIDELIRTGKSKHFESVMKGIPESVFELMKVPGIGPKSAIKLAKELGITKAHNALKQLEEAVSDGRVKEIEGFGETSEEAISRAINETRKKVRRMKLPYAANIADEIKEYLLKYKAVEKVDVLGSLRRRAPTIGDIDFAVASSEPQKVLKYFTSYPKAKRVIEMGDTKAAILIPGEIQVDLRVLEPEDYGSLLQHFTGSKNHNIALREYALKLGFSLSEYGILDKRTNNKHHFKTEEDFYNFLKLSWIPPELREDTGEIELAKKHNIPTPVELKDIKGDLQIHSNYDIETSHDIGVSSIEEILEKANEKNYEYIALTDHNPSRSGHMEAQVIDILKKRKEYIEEINYTLVKNKNHENNSIKKVYNSLEIDITPEGALSIPEKALEYLDFALVSIHSSFRQTSKEMTKRILNALSYPKIKIFAHPTGRLLGEREGIEADWNLIFDFCIKNKKYIEINGDPARLDLPDYLVVEAKNQGVTFSMGTDSHAAEGLNNMEWAISVARRGGLTKKEIINTLNFEEFDQLITE